METGGVKKMKNILVGSMVGILLALAVMPGVCHGITGEELKVMLGQDEAVTIIDIRDRGLYTEGHIPGAINIPSGIIESKQLPPIGRVIVCGDGIRNDLTLKALDALNSKEGIQAEMLEGGFAAWEALNFPNTGRIGVKRELFRSITYQEFQKASADNSHLVLVDMRRWNGEEDRNESEANLSDLSGKFPGLEILTLENRGGDSGGKNGDIPIAAIVGHRGPRHDRIYVLIDSGGGEAERLARRLHAAGITEIAILLGGEEALKREGRPGFQSELGGN